MSERRPEEPRPAMHADDWDEPLASRRSTAAIDAILVPVDGSAGSERGSRTRTWSPGSTGAEIVVVVAFDPPLAIRRRGILQTEHLQVEMERTPRSWPTRPPSC